MQLDLDRICTVINREKCQVHGEPAKAQVEGTRIKLTTCCTAFQKKLEGHIDNMILGQVDDAMDDAFSFR